MSHIITEVTGLFPVEVESVCVPHSVEEISEFLKKSTGKISIGGGRYSMGGQTAIVGGAQLDMREMNQVIALSIEDRTITVQAGIRWRDIQDHIDPFNLSIMTMQTYSNFTVGGALSVNCHGRYIGFGPIILSVISLKVALANGDILMVSPTKNSDIFFGTVGGYGGISIILEATLKLQENTTLERTHVDMPTSEYGEFFQKNIRDTPDVIFHNGDIYPPHYTTVRATSWGKTKLLPTPKERLITRDGRYTLPQKVYSIIRLGDFGKWFRQYIIDPLVYSSHPIHRRNYEASYDVAELEPKSRKEHSYVLEEYFCPVEKFNEFIPKMTEIFNRYGANIINVSIRHALPDSGSLLAWAQEEVFAFVIYYNQCTSITERREVAVWTRELIDAVLSVGGRYYLPYQLHGTLEQVQQAYPRWDAYAQLKAQYDPVGRLSNSLLEKYYFEKPKKERILSSRFATVYDTEKWRDAFYIFLQNIFHIAPTHSLHSAIWDIVIHNTSDQNIYERIQQLIPVIRPFGADLRYGIPALKYQKQEMAREVNLLLKKKIITGYLEIGGAGRYIQPLKKRITIHGPIYLLSDEPIDFSPVRILERGRISKYNTFPLTYTPSDVSHIADNSLELVTIFIGLHHASKDKLGPFFEAILSKVKKGGSIIVRDHNVNDVYVHTFVSIAHDIYNAGTGASWSNNDTELRNFQSIDDWKIFFESHHLTVSSEMILQKNDPTDNTLMLLTKK